MNSDLKNALFFHHCSLVFYMMLLISCGGIQYNIIIQLFKSWCQTANIKTIKIEDYIERKMIGEEMLINIGEIGIT